MTGGSCNARCGVGSGSAVYTASTGRATSFPPRKSAARRHWDLQVPQLSYYYYYYSVKPADLNELQVYIGR